MRRLAVLFSRLSGYMAACLRALQENHGVSILVIRRPPSQEAPFEERQFSWIEKLYDRTKLDPSGLMNTLEAFGPDAVLMSGWMDRDYLRAARSLKRQGSLVVAGSDTQWSGAVRQQIGRLISPWYLNPSIDVLWVAGERQRQLADHLGFRGSRCWSGIYACDWERFAEVYRRRTGETPRSFLFVGRYVPQKGLDVLVRAYRQYRTMVRDPWPLVCAGAGPQKMLLAGQEGIVDRGFIQPDRLPELMAEAGTFILPSRKEPWGVVVQEAAAAGVPLICSDRCGAAVHLLQDRFNGFTFESGNADHLARRMATLTQLETAGLEAMRDRSHLLSQQYTPERWAETLVQGFRELRAQES